MRVETLPASEATALLAARLRWQYFVTLTYGYRPEPKLKPDFYLGKNPPPVSVRHCMLVQWMRQIHSRFNLPGTSPFSVQALVRTERGEKGGRIHHHALVTLDGIDHPTIGGASALKMIWQRHCGASAGHCDSRIYQDGLPGVDYVLKALGSFDLLAANGYELERFGSSNEERSVIFTPGAVWSLFKQRSHRSRHEAQQAARLLRRLRRDQSSRGVEPSFWRPASLAHPYSSR